MLDLITLPYARPRWSGLLRQLFAQYDEHAVPLAIPVPEGGLAEAIHQLGVVTLPRDAGGENLALAVIEITASDAVALLRNRVGIRNLAARLLSPGTADGLLVATTQPGNPAWRFTFVHRETRFDDAGTLVRQETPTRRFTYVLGPGESCRTPDTRFQFLARHRGATALAHVLDAFSVEKLSQEFFTQYHFTIDENDPEDHEIGIDPEMLGRIFENLLEDNKEKGAFYTPKPVVQEMCQRSLIQSLASRYPGDPEALAAIENLIRLKEPINPRKNSWLARHRRRKIPAQRLGPASRRLRPSRRPGRPPPDRSRDRPDRLPAFPPHPRGNRPGGRSGPMNPLPNHSFLRRFLRANGPASCQPRATPWALYTNLRRQNQGRAMHDRPCP